MKIGFINTSSKQNFKPFRIDPLGSLYLLTILEKEFGDSLELSFTDLRGVKKDSLIYHIPEKDIYLYSVTSPDYPELKNTAENLKKMYPKAKHIAGGPHINIFPEESLKTFDTICLGEGEESIKEIVKDEFKSDLKRVYKQKNPIKISLYPYPSRKYLPESAITDKGLLSRKYFNLVGTSALFSWGCPFDCHFCSNSTKRSTRFRSPKQITEEIEYLKREYKIETLLVKDDNGISINKEIAKQNLEAISKTNILWRAQTRANGVHPDMIKLAKESGCIELSIGVESISQRVLNIINKKIDINLAKQYLNLLKKEGIDRKLLLIMGLPGEPKDIANKTIDFIKEVEPSTVVLSLLCPIPGSEIYNNPKRFGIKINYDIPFDKYLFAFGRFDEKEKPPRIFEYEKTTPFGEGISMDEILENHKKVQSFLKDNDLNF